MLQLTKTMLHYVDACAPDEADGELYLNNDQGLSVRVPVKLRERRRTAPLVFPG